MAIFTHVTLGAKDLGASKKFYDATLSKLGVNNVGPMGDKAWMYGKAGPEFIVLSPANGEPATHANGGTLGFAAESRAQVRAFHEAGTANGGTCEGPPGPAPLRQPLTRLICAIQRATRSARIALRRANRGLTFSADQEWRSRLRRAIASA